jgi:hypothetical protein
VRLAEAMTHAPGRGNNTTDPMAGTEKRPPIELPEKDPSGREIQTLASR